MRSWASLAPLPMLCEQETEFAVLVRCYHKGQGIGWMLMKRLVDIARQHGFKKLTGLVLVENTNIVEFCRDLGLDSQKS